MPQPVPARVARETSAVLPQPPATAAHTLPLVTPLHWHSTSSSAMSATESAGATARAAPRRRDTGAAHRPCDVGSAP